MLQHPGLERGAPGKSVDPAQDGQPGVLNHLLGDRRIRHERGCKLQHRRVMARGKLDEGLLVAGTQARHQLVILLRSFAAMLAAQAWR